MLKYFGFRRCIVCGRFSPSGFQCRRCRDESDYFIKEFNKYSFHEMHEHYYGLKKAISNMTKLGRHNPTIRIYCNKLITVAVLFEERYRDASLLAQVYTDIAELLNTFSTATKHSKAEKTSQDGHQVKSNGEVIIDDILFNNFVLHSYDKPIAEILEKRKKSDWFIPIFNGQGIYLEYWGMDTPEYQASRKEKENLYKKYNVPYIGIEKGDPTEDTMTFTNNLLREISTLAIERYGFMPKWK